MENISQLQLIPQVSGNTQVGIIDITEDTIIPITFSISDVRDLTQKNGTFSKSIKVKGTKNNNKLFKFYFDVNLDDTNISFNINKLAFCNVIQNGEVILDNALLQLISVTKKQETNLYDDEIEYQLLIKDTTSDFFNIINNKYLEEIDLGLPLDKLTPEFVVSTFSNTVAQGYKYILGYAGGQTGDNASLANDALIKLEEFKPAIFAKKYFDAIFLNAGYKYDWKSIDDPTIRFSKLIIPYNGEDIKGTQIDDSNLANIVQDNPAGQSIWNVSSFNFGRVPERKSSINYIIPLPPKKVEGLQANFDPNLLFNPATQIYTVPDTVDSSKSNVSIKFRFDMRLYMNNNAGNPVQLRSSYNLSDGNTTGSMGVRPYARLVKVNGEAASEAFFLLPNIGASVPNMKIYPTGQTTVQQVADTTVLLYSDNLKAGDQFYIHIETAVMPNGDIKWDFNDRIFDTHPTQSQIKYVFQNQTTGSFSVPASYFINMSNVSVNFEGHIDNGYSNGTTVRYNRFIPQKIKQADFIKSIATMFNLYFEVDKVNNKLIHIYGRNEYYDAGRTVDWTSKLDKGVEQELRFLPEQQNKQFLLTYKQDSDFANETYFNSTNEIYSQFLYSFDNQYVKDVKRNELVFSPTPIYFHSKLDAVLPFINGLEPKNNIRILYDGGVKSCNQYTIQAVGSSANDKEKQLAVTTYPLASHWNDVRNADFSIEFGTNDYYFLTNSFGTITTNNLFNMHWRRTLDTINNGRMFVGQFFLTENDIATLQLNQKVLVYNSEWVINKIIDYDGNSQKTTKVELINIDDKQTAPIFKKQPQRTDLFNDFKDLFTRWNLLRDGGLFSGAFSPITSSGFNNWNLGLANSIGTINGSNNSLVGTGTILGDDNKILTRPDGFHNIFGNGNDSLSDFANIFGSGNRIGIGNNFSNISGNGNEIGTGTTDNNIWGHWNILSGNNRNSFILGSENELGLGTNGGYIFGSGNTISSGLSRIFIFGDNVTGTSSNTSYFDNIIISSGSTINNIPIQAYMGGYNDTGVIDYTGITVASPTQINIPPIAAWFVDNETNPLVPTKERVIYTGATNVTVPTLSAGFATYVFLRKDKTIFFQNTFPTSAERKTMCFLGKLGHPAGVINVGLNSPDFATSPNAQTRDMWKAFGFINRGVIVTPLSGLTIGRSAGILYGNGVSFHLNPTIPNEFFVTAQTSSQIFYRTQTGGTSSAVTVLDPTNYDVGGVITPVGGGANTTTIQYVFAVPGAPQYVIQYGQNTYPQMADAIAAVGKESFVQFPSLVHNGVLIGVIAINKNATNVLDPATVRFFNSDIFGQLVGSAGGSPTTSLQGAYNNSSNPEIVLNSTLQAIQIRGWNDNNTILEFQDTTGGTISSISVKDAIINGLTVGRGGGNNVFNTAFGLNALSANTTGQANTAVGRNALNAETTAFGNVAVGHQALQFLTSGTSNTAVGTNCLGQNVTGNTNVAMGNTALFQQLGNDNVGIGTSAIANLANGSGNTAVGTASLLGLQGTAILNTALGFNAGRFVVGSGATQNGSINNSIFIGANSKGQSGTTNAIVIGNDADGRGANNTVIGNSATTGTSVFGYLYTSGTGSTLPTFNGSQIRVANAFDIRSTGTGTTSSLFFGTGGLNATGNANLAIGHNALPNVTTSITNIAIGNNTLTNVTSGASNNIAIGRSSLVNSSFTNFCVAIGQSALGASISGSSNIAIGSNCLSQIFNTNDNIAIGKDCAVQDSSTNIVTQSTQSIFIGNGVRPLANGNTNQIVIGYLNDGQGSNTVSIGNAANTKNYFYGKILASGTDPNLPTDNGAQIRVNNAFDIRGDQDDLNLFVGWLAGSNWTGFDSVGIGQRTLSTGNGDGNTAVGTENQVVTTTATFNSSLGYQSLRNLTSGSYNVGIGAQTLFNTTTGDLNVAVGLNALRSNIGGDGNNAFGAGALQNLTGNTDNCAFGNAALNTTKNGFANTAIGNEALSQIDLGSNYNTALGRMAGTSSTGSSGNNLSSTECIFIGDSTQPFFESGNTNQTIIGSKTLARGGNNTMTFGNLNITNNYFRGLLNTNVGYKTDTGNSINVLVSDGTSAEHYGGSFSGGISISPNTGITVTTTNNGIFTKIGDTIIANLGFSFSVTAATNTTYTFTVPLPFLRASSTQRFIGQANFEGGLHRVGSVLDSTSTSNATIIFTRTISGTESVKCNVTYQYNTLI